MSEQVRCQFLGRFRAVSRRFAEFSLNSCLPALIRGSGSLQVIIRINQSVNALYPNLALRQWFFWYHTFSVPPTFVAFLPFSLQDH